MTIPNKVSKISYIYLTNGTPKVNSIKMIKITIQMYVCKQHNFLIQLTQPGVMFLYFIILALFFYIFL